MKLCPNCKAELDDHARFCLCCMTPLDEKEQIPPPAPTVRRWPLVLLSVLLLLACAGLAVLAGKNAPSQMHNTYQTEATPAAATQFYTVDGVRYTFRPATQQDHPTAVRLENYYVLIRVEGAPADGIYRVPSFVGNDTNALVVAIAENAFAGTEARAIDLGYNVRYVWGNAFGGYPLTDLYLHTDVAIQDEAFSGCNALTIHCPDYVTNTEDSAWCELAIRYGFQWQPTEL